MPFNSNIAVFFALNLNTKKIERIPKLPESPKQGFVYLQVDPQIFPINPDDMERVDDYFNNLLNKPNLTKVLPGFVKYQL